MGLGPVWVGLLLLVWCSSAGLLVSLGSVGSLIKYNGPGRKTRPSVVVTMRFNYDVEIRINCHRNDEFRLQVQDHFLTLEINLF